MDPCCELFPETWRPVPGYEGLYTISDHGRVFSVRANRLLKPSPDVRGRLRVELLGRTYKIHRLVLLAFDKPCPDGMEGCHWDDIKTNNHLPNLRWDTSSANKLDRLRNGNDPNASKTHCPKNHEYTPENTYFPPGRPGWRMCRECRRREPKH